VSAQVQGFFEYVGEIRPLPITIQFMWDCGTCKSEQIFICGWECDAGLVGYCIGCGSERIALFTRTNSEVA
jgi:hypothetical protein